MIKDITSIDNKIFKTVKKLKNKNGRQNTGLFMAEGYRIVCDAVESGLAQYIFISESFGLCEFNLPIYRVNDKMFSLLSETETTQGILAVCTMPEYDILKIHGDTIVICDGVSDPGNLGTIIRTAECSGVSGVIALAGCVDPFSPKVVRSTMGSIFRVPIYFAKINDLQILKKYDIIATSLDGSESLYKTQFKEKNAIVIGNEARGISDEVLKLSSKRIKIPMVGSAESLNAAVAGAVVMYELYRRRA